MKKWLAGALFAAPFLAVACSSTGREASEKNPAPCPNAIVLTDAARLIEFDGESELENVAYTGEITGIESACRYYGEEPIEADIKIDMAFGKGPKGADGEKYFKYFVAVTRTNLEVIAKKEFIAPIEFDEKKTVVVTQEEIDEIVIPRAGEEISGTNFEIVVGFTLTPAQAIYNRSGKSLKFPDLQ